jgi:hypothetical protein
MSITVYWAPNYEFGNIDWNMLYADPISVFDKQIEQKTTVDKWDSMFYCPAFKNLTKNTLEFKNPLASTFLFDEQGNVTPSKNGMTAQTVRQPNIKDRFLLEYGITPIFFSDADISVTMTSPWLETPQWASQANIVPGRYNIGKWFRAVNIEFMMGQGIKELTIEKDEPLAYFTFNTDEHVKFVRFKMDPELRRYSVSCATSTSWEPWIPLADRYRRFQESRMRSIILKKIKENIVE